MAVRELSRVGLGRVYMHGVEEAKRRGDRRVGTDHIALALLRDPDSLTARALGVSLVSARAALDELDRRALATVGIEAEVPVLVLPVRGKERLGLTPAGREVFTGLRWGVAGRRVGVQHVLDALLDKQPPDPAAELFAALGVDRSLVRARLEER